MGLQCFDNIIGITESTCECLTVGLGNEEINSVLWYKVSKSGLYLDRLPGIVDIKGVNSSTPCDDQVATFYKDAIKDAIKFMHDDMVAGLLKKFKQVKLAYSGKALSTDYTIDDAITQDYAGVMIRTEGMKGGSLQINNIFTMFNSTGTITLKVYRGLHNSDNIEFVEDITAVATEANKIKPNILANPKIYPLCEEGYDYYFVYQRGEMRPKNNPVDCGCGNSQNQLREYANFWGIVGNDLNNITNFQQRANASGLAFDLAIGCDTSAVVCDLYKHYQDFKVVMSHAVRFKAGELVQEAVANSGEVNRLTMLNKEHIWGKRNHFRSEYADRIMWMVENANLQEYECYICNNKTLNIRRAGIRS